MHIASPAEIFGMDGIIVLVVVVLVLFGSTQIPKLARSLGSAQKEFKKGVAEGGSDGTSRVTAVVPAGQSVAVTSSEPAAPGATSGGRPAADVPA